MFGGITSGQVTVKLTFALHPARAACAWRALAPLPEPLFGQSTVPCPRGEKIYLVGACDGLDKAVRRFLVYDIAKDAWESLGDTPFIMGGPGASQSMCPLPPLPPLPIQSHAAMITFACCTASSLHSFPSPPLPHLASS